jgi:4-alpha-glucanotransferase
MGMIIKHDSREKYYRDPFGAAQTGSDITLSIDIEDPAPESVRLMLWHDDDPNPQYIDMKECAAARDDAGENTDAERSGASRYTATVTAPDEGCLLWYAFEIETEHSGDGEEGAGRQLIYYGNNHDGFGGEGSIYYAEPLRYQITVYKPAKVPEWYREGIVYQIFPDRFARDDDWRKRTEAACERVNRRRSDMRRFVQEDWTQPAFYERDGSGRVTGWPMYGGSLKGIEERLDYIKSLGVTCIYLNPVFEATSNHRYDTGDYMHIEPALGTDEDFESLAKAAKERGIRIILDGVFSHTGCDSIYFDKYGNYRDMRDEGSAGDGGISAGQNSPAGAWNDTESPYRSWFKFDESESCGYKSWWGVDDLPEVNENDPGYREFILGEDGVVAHWLRMGASGWRLDVADELPDSFIAETRKRIKETDPDALLLGEVWEDASNKISYGERRRYFMGDELDSTMHYPLRDILLDYINYTISAPWAENRLMSLAENYPPQNLYGALNLIGSHDRERIMTMMAGEQDYPSATKKVRLLSALQYCLPGVPCVYYGDEAGLMGGTDPANRSGFPWGFENLDLGYHYRMLGLIYDEHPALKSGSFGFLSGKCGFGDDIFAFTRSGRDIAGTEETLLILANRSYGPAEVRLKDAAGETLKCGYALELLTSAEMPVDEEGSLGTVIMDPLSVKIISLRKERPATEDLERSAGVICHISSLPGKKLGKGARDFVDYIASAGFSIWQMLPLNPAGMGNSPYSSYAAFAGEPAFIDRDELPSMDGYAAFIKDNAYWLYDYIAFALLREANEQRPWYEWSEEQRFAGSAGVMGRLSEAQKKRAKQLAEEQYYFAAQWSDLKAYANSKGVRLMGDLPMFMAADSADIWANKDIFMIGQDGLQKSRAGVPPDAFSEDGQDWGNPLYDWDKLRRDGYGWWLRRMRQCAERFDILRIDHFRGMSEYYSIPKGKTSKQGSWQHSAGLGFIETVKKMLKDEDLGMKLLAEDLGFLDAGVKNLLKLSGLPGMDIWQFSWGEMLEACEKEPEKTAGRAFYTGTHDNDTLVGWLMEQKRPAESEMDSDEMLRTECETEALEIIRRIYESPAGLAMMQLQDVFLLGSEARMNVPGVAEGNWSWKVPGESIEDAFADADQRAEWLRNLAERTGRLR